jgi:hypothetical protein
VFCFLHEVGDAGKVMKLQDFLIALKPEGAPDETIERWHLRVGRDVHPASNFFVHETPLANKVQISPAPLPWFFVQRYFFFTSTNPSTNPTNKPAVVLQWFVSVD